MRISPVRPIFRIALAVCVLALHCSVVSAADEAAATYLDRLNPVLHLHFDRAAEGETELANGTRLLRPENLRGSAPGLIDGPAAWTGKAWDFSTVAGPVMTVTNELQSRVGDPEETSGMTVSFWAKGEYSGRTSRIMAGPFDIGTSNTGLWGGTADYQNAATSTQVQMWDKQWHHVAVRVDFTAQTDNVDLWLDGRQVGTKTAFYAGSLATPVGRHWYFGARNPADEGFDFGALADIAVFDRPLSEAEIVYLHGGPVFAGLNQQVYLPASLQLDGIVPEGTEAEWTQVSGPEVVVEQPVRGATLTPRFAVAGEYEFQLAAAGLTSKVRIEVRANQPPLVHAGNGAVVDAADPLATLEGRVSDNGSEVAPHMQLLWSVVSAPEGGRVEFGDPEKAICAASFSGEGLYTLRLTGNDGEFSRQSDVCVLVGEPNSDSYVRLLQPLLLADFERPAVATSRAVPDAVGDTGLQVLDSETGLPLMIPGARSFTGHAWDFRPDDASIKVVNGIHLKPLHVKNHPARSVSFWIKGDESSGGYVSSFFGLMAIDKSGAIGHYMDQIASLTSGPIRVTDGDWHHVVLVLKTSSESVHRSLYLDGQPAGERSDPVGSEWKPLSSPAIRHSQHIASRGRSGADNLSAMLDDFALFDYALSEEDIAYLYHGPDEKARETLARLDTVKVEAGPDQFLSSEKDAPAPVSLTGSLTDSTGFTPRWSMVSGNGAVTFQDPDSAVTAATFDLDSTTKSGDYHKFVLRLALSDPNGREIAHDEVTVVFYPSRAPATREFTANPPPGEHPRVLFSRADLPELRRTAAQAPVAQRAVAAMRERVKVLRDPGQTYESVYTALLAGRRGNVAEFGGDNSGGFFLTLLEAAYLGWLGDGVTSDTARLEELGQVFAQAAREWSTSYLPNYENALVHDVNWAFGLCYDLLHDVLSEEERSVCRSLISAMTAFRQSVGVDEEASANSSNWRGFHDHFLMCLLAIEGEQGFDEKVLDVTEWKNSVFQTEYGIFNSGLPHEGYAYYTFGMQWMAVANLAIARRPDRENLFETSRFYASIETAFRLMDPDGSGIRSHHDVVEGPSGSGVLTLPPRHVVIAKHVWPEDRMIDYVYRQLTENLLAGEDRSFDFFMALWGEPVAFPEQTLSEAAGDLDPVKFCPDRGVVLARDAWKENGLRLDFRCRMDKYWLGHQHSDVNSFELWSHGREWIIDRGKFASTVNDVHATVLIDGVGGPSAKRYSWPSFPGRLLSFENSGHSLIGVGDAKPFYDWCFLPPKTDPGEPVIDHGLTWSDFYFPREGESMPEWMARMPVDLDGYGNTRGIFALNPVRRAVRSVALAKVGHPFVIVADDIDKDGQPHDYHWIANTCIGDRIVEVSQSDSELVLRHAGDEAAGGPRLLVRVLRADGQSGPVHLDRNPVIVEKEKIEAVRITIPCRGVAPNYRVLLYPFRDGDPLPETSWNPEQDRLQVKIGETRHEVLFAARDDAEAAVVIQEVRPAE